MSIDEPEHSCEPSPAMPGLARLEEAAPEGDPRGERTASSHSTRRRRGKGRGGVGGGGDVGELYRSDPQRAIGERR